MKICNICGKATSSAGYCHNCMKWTTVVEAKRERADCWSYVDKSKKLETIEKKREQEKREEIGKRNAEILNKRLERINPKKVENNSKTGCKKLKKKKNKTQSPKNELKKKQSKVKNVKAKTEKKNETIEELLKKARNKTAQIKEKSAGKIDKNLQRRVEKATKKNNLESGD